KAGLRALRRGLSGAAPCRARRATRRGSGRHHEGRRALRSLRAANSGPHDGGARARCRGRRRPRDTHVASRVDLRPRAVTFFTRRLRRAGSPARAIGEKAYLKSDLRFWGTTQDSIRAAVREYCDAHPELTRSELRRLAETLYATDVHELRAAAIGVLERDRGTLDDRDMRWLIRLVRKSKSWAYVDWIAPKVIGEVIARDPGARKHLAVWAR